MSDEQSETRSDGGVACQPNNQDPTATAATEDAQTGAGTPWTALFDRGPLPDRLAEVVTVGLREYRVLSRARWPVGLAAVFAVFSLAVVWLGGSRAGPGGAGALLVTLGELSVYLVPLAALALGYSTVVGADERGSLEPVLALPVARTDVAAGLYLGRAAALTVGLSLGLGAGGALFGVTYGVAVLPAYLNYLVAAVATGLGCLAVAVAVSALASEKARALAGSLVAWVWFVFVYDAIALGVVVAMDLPSPVLDLLVVANPVDSLRVVVLSLVPASGAGVAGTLTTTTVPLVAVLAGSLAWIVGPVIVAGWLLARRGR